MFRAPVFVMIAFSTTLQVTPPTNCFNNFHPPGGNFTLFSKDGIPLDFSICPADVAPAVSSPPSREVTQMNKDTPSYAMS